MSTSIERLIEFIVRRRNELGLSQRDAARASGINPGTLANIEVGRVTKAPTVGTLEKLEKGLRLPEETLSRIIKGEDPDLVMSSPRGEVGPAPTLSFISELGNHRYPPTLEERQIIADALAIGLGIGLFSEPGFWDMEPQERRGLFRDVEGAIEETRRILNRIRRGQA